MSDSDRRKHGLAVWKSIIGGDAAAPSTPLSAAMVDFVGAEVWSRPGLTRKDRRWVSLTCAAVAGQREPLRYHIATALSSGDISFEELQEFALHLAAYAGWPIASLIESTLSEFDPTTGEAIPHNDS